MRTAILMEYRKFFSTRMWWILLLGMAAYMAFFAVVMATSLSISVEGGDDLMLTMDPLEKAKTIYTIATAFGYVFPAIVGALSVTSEFRHQTITPTLLAEPNRTRLIGAKLLGSIPIGLLFGIAGTASVVLVGGAILELTGEGAMLTEASAWQAIGLSVVALTVWTVVGVGLGTAMTNQVAVVLVLLAFTQFVEPVLRLLLGNLLDGSLERVAAFLPGAAGESIAGASLFSSIGFGDLLPWWQGAGALVLYALGLALLGRVTNFRRDFT